MNAATNAEPTTLCPRVELQLLTTLRCNLRCTYCSLEDGDVIRSQRNATYSAAQLETFVRTQLADREVYFTLYGGEPTLNMRFAAEVMERFPDSRFNLQTNGTLLHRVPDAIVRRLSNVMVSLDGGQHITDGFRGRGVYQRVLDNVRALRQRTSATLCARMTWWSADTEAADIDALAQLFDYVYFQFAQDQGAHPPPSVARKKQVLTQLVDRFFESDTLYPIVPIMGTLRNKVAPQLLQELCAGMTQCRVSSNLLNVMPDGRIFPCPDMLYDPDLQQGDVVGNWLRPSPLQPHPAMPCSGCSAWSFCRGNCMKNLHLAYVRGNDDWRHQVTEPVCELIRHLGDEVDRHDPQAWFERAPAALRERLTGAPIYEYCEVMP